MPLAISQTGKKQFLRTSQNFNFPEGTIPGSAKDPRRFQEQLSSLWPSCTLRSDVVPPWELLTLPWASLQACCCWPTYWSFLSHSDFGQTHAQPPLGVQVSPGEKHEGRAAAVSGANSWSMVCLHAAGSHPPAAAQAAEAEASRGIQGGFKETRNTPPK